ncbi:hypothetical protein [Paenibacillus alkalitolerans]|uniref:hypothetical protein n=1 Tax=Paenibacillus alkalitolerans TaxID=2799335 RepID=UPI0018F67963|nr:hypothetical protein [Paenibacillus alkalitolerans]
MTIVKQKDIICGKIRKQALRFIHLEKQRVLQNFENGTTDKDQTIGSLNTLYQIASHVNDMECMKNIWQAIANVRNAKFALQHRLHIMDRSHMG